jgi:predicted enzyme related to lactoylglutathione lyase
MPRNLIEAAASAEMKKMKSPRACIKKSVTEFFGLTESPAHVPNENRVAFWAESAADVDRVAEVAARAGARNIEGPMDYESSYHAVFFEEPCGNRLGVCHRR